MSFWVFQEAAPFRRDQGGWTECGLGWDDEQRARTAGAEEGLEVVCIYKKMKESGL